MAFIIACAFPVLSQQQQPDTSKPVAKDVSSYITTDSLLKKVEQLHGTLNRITNVASRSFDTRTIEGKLPEIQNNIQLINESVISDPSALNSRNMQLFQVLLSDMQTQLTEWRNSLFDYNKELIAMHAEMQHFREDSNFLKQVRSDTLFRNLYKTELTSLRDKWKQASATMNNNLAKINELQATVSNNYFQAMELQQAIRKQLMRNSRGAFGQEYSYLWQFKNDSTATVSRDAKKKSFIAQRTILRYYFQKIQDKWVWLGLIGLLLFAWILKNFITVRKFGQQALLKEENITHISMIPVLSTLVLILNMAPFFDMNPPVVYIQMLQFFLMIILTVKLWRTWSRASFFYWIIILVLYFFFGFSNVVTNPTITFRCWLLIINIASIAFGIYLFQNLSMLLTLRRFGKTVTVIYIILNVLAALCNITGRVSIAKAMGSAAIFSITQLIGMSVFIQIIIESFHLQMIASRLTGGKTAIFNYEKIQKGLTRLLSTAAVVCWFIILTANLNIYPIIYSIINRLLNSPHVVGNISFTASHILLFFVILYVSNLLQKYIGYFLGETDEDFVGQVSKKKSKLAIIRLLLLLGGFLLAVAASGLAVDKITVVLGALGVGIGLGLQTIVNNLVSGIILIFERPFQIGDSIEIANKKGKVKDLGIRSSRIVTEDGAEIIIPNGDLLSGSVTNWTLSNDHIRAILSFKIQPVASMEEAKNFIMAVLNESEYVMQRLPKEILLESINDNNAELKVLFWISNINSQQLAKSLILSDIYSTLKSNGITLL